MRTIFSRQTSKGLLRCTLSGVDITFFLDDQEIKKRSIAGIDSIAVLKGKPRYADLYQQLVDLGATHFWNYQVALFNNEPELIKTAVAEAQIEKALAEKERIRNSDLVVLEELYDGRPSKVESDLFQWNALQDSYLTCKASGRAIYQMRYLRTKEWGSDTISDPTVIDAVRDFYTTLGLITKHAEEEYKRKLYEQDRLNPRPENARLKGLSFDEIKQKAQEWDDLYNEGGEGYNPYRNG